MEMDNQKVKKIIEKSRMKIAAFNYEKEDIKMPKKNGFKMVATFLLTIGMTASIVVYAGSVAYDKIWKEPENYTISNNITDEEKSKCISEEEAERIGNSYLKKIGLSEETIQSLGLTKEFFSNENIWLMSSQKATLTIDGETGILKSVQIPTWEYTIPYNYGITRVEARKVARELLEKYRPEGYTGEYELVTLRRNMETDEASYIWYAEFYKKYGDLLNKSERIYIGWVPTINGLYCLQLQNDKYENNEQKITKEEAIRIATDKDNKIETDKIIKETKAEIKIRQMNEEVYLRENFKNEYENGTLNLEKTEDNTYRYKENAQFYKTEGRVRKVWVVVVKYDIGENKKLSEYTYFVDSTTGEIIGGQKYDNLESEEIINNDEYNLIEK